MLLWPYLLEKAYANYYSSYENLCYGNPVDFVSELTGAPFMEKVVVSKKVEEEVLEGNLGAVGSALVL